VRVWVNVNENWSAGRRSQDRPIVELTPMPLSSDLQIFYSSEYIHSYDEYQDSSWMYEMITAKRQQHSRKLQ
jgi:hypothetical protein